MNRRIPYSPLLPVLLCIATGVLLNRFVASQWPVFLAVAASGALAAVRMKSAALLSAVVALGWLISQRDAPMEFSRLPSSDVRYEGVVEEVRDNDASVGLIVAVRSRVVGEERIKVRGFRTKVYVPSHIEVPRRGDVVAFSGIYSSPLRRVDLPSDDDGADYNYVNSISLSCFSPPDSVAVTGHERGIVGWFADRRERIADRILTSGADSRTAAFLCAVVAGDDSMIGERPRSDFASAGIAHVLALSGLHIGIITVILAILFFPVSLAGYGRLRWGLVCVALWMFAFMTGMSASVVRSVLMATAVIFVIILDRPRSSLNALCFAGIVILAVDPHSLYRIGFQLSFVATFAIILFFLAIDRQDKRTGCRRWMVNAAGMTIAATLATLPLSALYFHRVPLYFLPANIVAAVLMPVLVCGGILLTVLSFAGADAQWVVQILDRCYSALEDVGAMIASLPGAVIDGIALSGWVMIPAYLTVGALFVMLFARRRRWWRVAMCVCVAATAATAVVTSLPEKGVELHITRETRHTDIVVASGGKVTVYSTSQRELTVADSLSFVGDHAGFIVSRGADGIDMKRIDEECNPVFDIAGKRLRTAFSAAVPPDSVDYCLVVRQFKGDIVALGRSAAADTILLSNDIPKRRHLRYCRELECAGIAFRSLRDAAFHLSGDL